MRHAVIFLVFIGLIAYVTSGSHKPEPTAPMSPSTEAAAQDQPSTPFIATVENEHQWRADRLPVDWPKFSVVPGKRPPPSKTIDQKLDLARNVVGRWQGYKENILKAPPSSKETGAVIDYLLTINRSDPKFRDAWALFIDARRADRAAGEYERDIKDRKKRGVSVGMTAEQVLQSNWGKPQKINETITAGGRHEQWVYGGGYLYIDNGVLTSIQTSK